MDSILKATREGSAASRATTQAVQSLADKLKDSGTSGGDSSSSS